MASNRRRRRQDSSDDAAPRKAGRPPAYRPEFARQAERLCRLGATDADLADFFDVAIRTVERWKSNRPEFGAAVVDGKEQNDARVVRSLYHRAVGYSFDSEKVMQNKGAVVRAPIREHVPPDVQAAIFWLTNRQAENWKHKQELTGPGGGPIQTIDVTALSPIERQQRIAGLLTMNGGAGSVVNGDSSPSSPDTAPQATD